jgi:predicted MFS family arabinose efflux permease
MSRRLVAAACAPPLLVALDFAVVGVAVPRMRRDLGLDGSAAAWVFSAYNLTFGATLLAFGRLADRIGRRRMLLLGLALFAAACGGNAAAPSGGALIASRAVQGVGAAAMTPAALSLLTSLRPQGPGRDALVGAYGMAISAGFVTGALAAGALAGVADWRPVMLLGAPLALVAMAITITAPAPAPALPTRATPARAGIGDLLRRRSVRRAAAAGALVTATGVGGTLLLVYLLQDVRGHSPLETGLMLVPFGAAAPAGARVARAAGPGAGCGLGLLLQGSSFLALGLAADSAGLVAVLAAIAGFGLGHVLGNTSAAMTVVADLPADRHGIAAGLLATAQYLGGAAGPAAVGALGLAGHLDAGFAVLGATALAGAAAVTLGSRAPRR